MSRGFNGGFFFPSLLHPQIQFCVPARFFFTHGPEKTQLLVHRRVVRGFRSKFWGSLCFCSREKGTPGVYKNKEKKDEPPL